MELLAYVNGEFLPESDAKVSVFDHGLLYGDGIFEGIRAYNGRVFRLDDHLRRLFDSAKAIHMEIPHSVDEMRDLILELCRRNEIEDGYIRPVVTRGKGDLGLDPRKVKGGPTVVIIARPFEVLYGDKYEEGLELITSTYRRVPSQSVSPNIKSLNYLNQILARVEANIHDADEALLLDIQGYVSEASADNFFVVRDEVLTTPPTASILQGVTRQTVLEIAEQLGYETRERFFTLYDVYGADEAFITGTAAEIAPVVRVDDRVVGDGKPGRITKQITARYRDLVRSTGTPIYEKA
ncbi:MAG: branched-chain-amino-acid transaminase [Candidatus Thermoplasmatota archaeon]|nr:branched-chain-amino-acid transaminase [Candidatus Thermoplasmatota archaeon]